MNDSVVNLQKITRQYALVSLEMHETIARKAGFRGTDHKYLGFFLQRGKMTAGEFAELTGLTTGTVTGLIDKFEKMGIVKRTYDSADRRKVYVEPDTEKIKSILFPYYNDFQSETEELISSFSSDEIKIIQSYFIKALALATKTINKFK